MRSRKMGEENRVQEPFRGAWRESGSSGFLSSAWFDDRSMHRCDCLTERSLGA